mmetsp:Transcript_15883/g.31104  ORF Transcript_15883/g.31104 Transcript_15883/m.31104 type:complete len:239 (+) Transcript_15883:1-717(+)
MLFQGVQWGGQGEGDMRSPQMAGPDDEESECLLQDNPFLVEPCEGSSKDKNRGKGNSDRGLFLWKVQLHAAVVVLYYSRLTAAIHAITFLIAGLLLATSLGLDTPLRTSPYTTLALEACVSLSLVAEVVLRAYIVGKRYLQKCANIVDVLVASLSTGFLFVAAPRAGYSEERREDLGLSQSLVMTRIVMQFARLLLIAEHSQRSRRDGAKGEELDLDFAALREHDGLLAKRCSGDDGL